MANLFGHRLKAARKMAGMSLETLAAATGNRITKQAISKYEKGVMKPDSRNLIALAAALQVDTSYFYRKATIELTGLEFRKKARLPKKEKDRIENVTLDFLERYKEIETIMGKPAKFKHPLKNFKARSRDDVEKAAEGLRKAWKLGENPIPNLMELLEDKGVRLCQINAKDSFDGLSGWIGKETPVIIINATYELVRKRFTIAHELGHLLLTFTGIDSKTIEKLCHAFAGALLLPKTAIIAALGKVRGKIALLELTKLKGIYGISVWAIMARANNLGIISDNTYKLFCISANKRGWRKREPGSYNRKERANRFDQLVYQAVAEQIITMSKGAELMKLKLTHFRKDFELVT